MRSRATACAIEQIASLAGRFVWTAEHMAAMTRIWNRDCRSVLRQHLIQEILLISTPSFPLLLVSIAACRPAISFVIHGSCHAHAPRLLIATCEQRKSVNSSVKSEVHPLISRFRHLAALVALAFTGMNAKHVQHSPGISSWAECPTCLTNFDAHAVACDVVFVRKHSCNH